MNNLIHRSEITPSAWIETSLFRLDGKEEFRELPSNGNRHAVFVQGDEWGEIHTDEHNAVDFPVGTIRHLGKYTNEKTGIPEDLAKVAIVLGGAYVAYNLLKYLDENL